MSMRFKLLIIGILFISGYAIFGIIAWSTLNTTKINGDLYNQIALNKDLIADTVPPTECIIEPYGLVFQMLEETDNAKLKELAGKAKKFRHDYEKQHAVWVKALPEGKLKELMVVQSYQPAIQFFDVVDNEFVPAVIQGNKDKASKILDNVLKPKYVEHITAIGEIVKLADKELKVEEASAASIVAGRLCILGVLGVATIFLFCFAVWFFVDRGLLIKIVKVMAGIAESVDQVASATSQIASSSQELAEGASEQAASIEQTSSSLEEMSSMTKQNASNANQANKLMDKSRRVVSQANQSMADLTASMQEISRASEETSKIIKTIDEIAFQTNLLALNAAVEAARAGEAGAGFAVVADEVRNLAMRAAEAAKNTANLIEGTVKEIKQGSDVVQKTSAEFSEVQTGTVKMGELVGEISAASSEQAQGIEQISKAVNEMDKVVQRNAGNAEESASASEEMSGQAEQMRQFVAELETLVVGAKSRSTSGGATALRKKAPFKKAAKDAGMIGVIAKKARGHLNTSDRKASVSLSKRNSGAERIIPFDDPDVSDF